MSNLKNIKSALVSVYYKDGLEEILTKLHKSGVLLYSTGGTKQFIEELKIPVTAVEELTGYPSILGGRVKTLHPKVFGGILARRENESDKSQLLEYAIPEIDLVIVDLYPFEATVKSGASDADIIEKIDIGGISLIRAAAKNHKDVLIVSHQGQYGKLLDLLNKQDCASSLADRRQFAAEAFATSSHYDTSIYKYFAGENSDVFRQSFNQAKTLRYGENPHQKGVFFGDFEEMFTQLQGNEISYNNLLDIDAAVNLIDEFSETTFAILKHNNACGCASRGNVTEAFLAALAGDPVSAFGGIFVTNREVNHLTAEEAAKIFFEVIIAPSYTKEALDVFKGKKNLIVLVRKSDKLQNTQFRTVLNGVIQQDRDSKRETIEDLQSVTVSSPGKEEIEDLLFANRLVKQSKSNTIVLAKGKQLLASGVGQTSRVDALRQAIEKAKSFNFELKGAVMASDAFFPFPDCVEIAHNEGITSVIQPGGSIRDKESVDFCNNHQMSMVTTGFRHFKH
ncbi:MAG TPA: bifunctional phosphoribosylaminoimidazolecarboxamide formyltransferase/IMP cyclohydrolase [Prolixibacteraceae bacterium]|nr:bifunctional phosphoribosylaminoimidazolecarboxamide formyltransferase/IMP cyclohydrolase [Prolixibacteraceae bacterium]